MPISEFCKRSIKIKVGHPHQVIGTAVLFVVVLEHDAGITEHVQKEGIGYKIIDLFLHHFTIRHYSDCAVRSYLVELAFFSCVAHPAVIRDFCISIRYPSEFLIQLIGIVLFSDDRDTAALRPGACTCSVVRYAIARPCSPRTAFFHCSICICRPA